MNQDTIIILAAIGFNIIFADMIRGGLDKATEYLRDRVQAFMDNEPYFNKKQRDEALENFLSQPYEKFIDALSAQEEDGNDHYKICPECMNYKRNFMTSGRKRMCMDCYIGNAVE